MLTALQKIVKNLGQQMLSWREASIDGIWEGTQLKTKADMDAHHFLIEELTKLVPDLPIISEENTDNHNDNRPECYFLIDPIDGTASFAGGFDGFVTQIAVMKNNQPVMGVVYAPARDELFSAEKGGGAFLNGKKLLLQENASQRRSLIDNYPEPRGIAEIAYRDLNCTDYVECGSLGLKICKIADGTADIFIKDVVLKDWDVAPADLILTEAGGQFSRLNGENFDYTGNYHKKGIVAVRNKMLANDVNVWHKTVQH